MGKSFYQRSTCRLCGDDGLEEVLRLKPSALCDAYISKEHLNEEQEIFPLELYKCGKCGFVFLPCVVDPEIIYRDYLYITTSSHGLSKHFQHYAAAVLGRIAPPNDSLVVDIGSNDGTLLKHFKARKMRVLGIEPATAIASVANEAGIETVPDFFTAALAEKLRKDYGAAQIITINNLFANIDDLDEITGAVTKLLAPEGVLVIESSYLADLIKNMVFDFIYHEHVSYFSVKPLITFFRRFGLEMIDIERVPTKGGSLRYYIQPSGGPRSVSPRIGEMIDAEEKAGLYGTEIYAAFARRIDTLKDELTGRLSGLKAEGKTIVGYGGSATTTTLVYHFEIAGMLDYIVDDNPAKIDTFSPGYHIPVLSSDVLYERRPDYTVMLAWRYADPIIKKHQRYLQQGGHFIVPLPKLEVI